MADNALGTLFSNIANAIRSKTASFDTMKPNDFPAKIMSISQIIHESGGEYVPPENGASSLKINCGQFHTDLSTGVRMQTIEHGLGTVPEFVAVYGGGISREFAANGHVSIPKLVYAYGFHSSFASQISSALCAVNFTIGFQVSTEKGIDEDKEKVGFITNCDSEKFLVGYGEDRNDGFYEFEYDADYFWIAMSGIGSSGGGSMEGVHTVTFMSEDGQTELFKRPVADGDNCADPVARGLMDAPTKESTAQYDFTYAGWSATPGGSADAAILNAVKADKTVYAAFTASTRYYTIRFFDGETMLHTVLAEYGSTPSYAPTKDGFNFEGWTPEIVAVTDDADYFAQWSEALSFAGASWADIAEICESGQAENTFKIGDTKQIQVGGETVAIAIAGFNHDDLADGSGKASMTLVFESVTSDVFEWGTNKLGSYVIYSYNTKTLDSISSILNTEFPSELKSIVKPVIKKCDATKSSGTGSDAVMDFEQSLWLLSLAELGVTNNANNTYAPLGNKYDLFESITSLSGDADKVTKPDGTAVGYWTRQGGRNSGVRPYIITDAGKIKVIEDGQIQNYNLAYRLGFCI